MAEDYYHAQTFNTVLAAWNKAMATWNSQQLAGLYTEQAIFIGSLPGLRQGRAAIKQYFAAIAGRRVHIDFVEKTLVTISAQCFVVSGLAVFEQDIDGAAPRLERRLSWLIEQQAGNWRIALHHVSTLPEPAGEFLY